MADGACNEACGCPVPCPGGDDVCRCRRGIGGGAAAAGGGGGGREGVTHSLCTCGEHCSCNPCACGLSGVRAVAGRAACTCGPGCACRACAT